MPEPTPLSEAIAARRADTAFMDRLARRIEEDSDLLEQLRDDPYEPTCCLCGRRHYGGCG